MKKFVLLILLLSLSSLLVAGQEAEFEPEDAAYLRLNSNFSVPELRTWDSMIESETVLFTDEDLNAQIYVRIVDTLDYAGAIATAINDIIPTDTSDITLTYEGRIGRTDGTWNYQLFSDSDTSISAFALLKSNQMYVVVFAEASADYDAYHLAIRSSIPEPDADDILTAINPAAQTAIQSAFNPDFDSEPNSVRNPAENNARWIEASYDNELTTASYFYEGIIYVTVVEGSGDVATTLSNAFDTVFLGFVITPDNSEFLYLGLGFATAIMLALIGSMYLRYQNLKKDLATIEALAESD